MKLKHYIFIIAFLTIIGTMAVLIPLNNQGHKKTSVSSNYHKVDAPNSSAANSSSSSNEKTVQNNSNNTNKVSGEKRGNPTYDYIMGSDGWPHYRVFFWVPKNATKLTPYADKGIDTNVSDHGPAEKWSVEDAKKENGDEKLVFIYVPKTFIFLFGKGFEKVIHLRY